MDSTAQEGGKKLPVAITTECKELASQIASRAAFTQLALEGVVVRRIPPQDVGWEIYSPDGVAVSPVDFSVKFPNTKTSKYKISFLPPSSVWANDKPPSKKNKFAVGISPAADAFISTIFQQRMSGHKVTEFVNSLTALYKNPIA